MAAPIHVSQRDAARDLEIATMRASASRTEVANHFGISPAAVTATCAKVRKQKTYDLKLGRPNDHLVPVGQIVTHKGFAEACIGAYRHFGEFFRGLDLPDWYLTDGTARMRVAVIREELAKRTN